MTTRLPRPDYFNHPLMAPDAHLVTDETRIEAVEKFAPLFQRAWGDWLRVGQADFDARIEGPGDATLRALQDNGIAMVKFDPAAKARINELVAGELDAIQAKVVAAEGRLKFRDMNTQLVKADWPEVYALVEEAFAKLQILKIGGAYVRKPLRIKRLYVQINNEWETRHRYGVIDDNGVPARKSDYWHIDSDIFPNFKSLFYLNDVTMDQGPFRYIPGTHRDLDPFETVARKVNDSLKLTTPHFLSLPEALRLHALFGPYMTGEEPEAKALLEREIACLGDDDLILFDNNGVHRGGFVRKGSRRLMQILFEPG